MSKKYLTKIFAVLSKKDFIKYTDKGSIEDVLLYNFYKSYQQSSEKDLLEYYLTYITRNDTTVDQNSLMDEIKTEIKPSNGKPLKKPRILRKLKLFIDRSYNKSRIKLDADRELTESEKYLIKVFSTLQKKDFYKKKDDGTAVDQFLYGFYKSFRKEKSDNIFDYYIEYITRNVEFAENEREQKLCNLYDEIKDSLLTDVVDKRAVDDFGKTAINPYGEMKDSGTVKKTVKVLKKSKVLAVISLFIQQSSILVNENVDDTITTQEQEVHDDTAVAIMKEIAKKVKKGKMTLPEPKPDLVFGQRNEMLNIWQNTYQRIEELKESQKALVKILKKIYYVDSTHLLDKQPEYVDSEELSTDFPLNGQRVVEIILPSERFTNCYTNTQYSTIIKLSNNHPIEETTMRCRAKNKTIYICSGSQNICGGNADQGLDNAESMLYMTSSYSLSLSKALHAYPLKRTDVIVMPNVLVFKNTSYEQEKDLSKWQRIAVMNAPCVYTPQTNLEDQIRTEFDERLLLPTTKFSDMVVGRVKNGLKSAIETALFFGYDSIVLDDRGIFDNWLPAHHVALIIKDVIFGYRGRVKEFVICAEKSKIFNVFRYHFQ